MCTNFYLVLGESFEFWEADFHKIKGRETQQATNDTTDDNMGLTEHCSVSTELLQEFKVCFGNFFSFLLIFIKRCFGQNHV
jgi:hypothetical protein